MRLRGPAAALSLLVLAGCATVDAGETPPAELSDGRPLMGTVLEITLHGPDPAALARARDRIFALAERFDSLFSRYRASSDVSRLNAAGGKPLAVQPEVAELVGASLRLSARTRGSFDVTVGPLVSLWIDAAERGRLPGAGEILAARERVGSQHVRVLTEGRVALAPGSRLDLGGVAKGFSLDRMLPVLREEGVESALLSFGQSSAWAFGAPPGAAGWTLLVRAPDGGFAGLVTLRDRALSVSGSLGQWTEIEGRRYGHVLDPRSGWPLTRRRQAVVVAGDATLAEALSKALLVLGETEGLEVVAAQEGCEALLQDADGTRFASAGFAAATGFEPLDVP